MDKFFYNHKIMVKEDLNMIKLIVGLGNPTAQYEGTRHNAGFYLVDQLLSKYSHKKMKLDVDGELYKINVNNQDIFLLKPMTFMNDSGISVSKTMKELGLNNDEILIVHDEIHLVPGKINLKYSGSSGGNNGIKSIISFIGESFWRLRLGIGKPENNADLLSWVLSKPEQEEFVELFNKILIIISDILLLINNQNDFQQKYNRK